MPQTQRWCHHSNRQYAHTSAGTQREWMGRIWLIAPQCAWRLIARLWLMWQAMILPAQAKEMKKGPDGRYFWQKVDFYSSRCDFVVIIVLCVLHLRSNHQQQQQQQHRSVSHSLPPLSGALSLWAHSGTWAAGERWHCLTGLLERRQELAHTNQTSPPQLPLHSLWTSTPIFPKGGIRWHDYHHRVIIKCSSFPEIELRNNIFKAAQTKNNSSPEISARMGFFLKCRTNLWIYIWPYMAETYAGGSLQQQMNISK